MQLGEKIIRQAYAPVAQEFLKKGCPKSLRADIWSIVLNTEITAVVCIYNFSTNLYLINFVILSIEIIINH